MFVSKKTLKKNNDILFKRNSELDDKCKYLQKELIDLRHENRNLKEKNKELENIILIHSEKLEEKSKECKRLKTLLTKNKIEYRKEN